MDAGGKALSVSWSTIPLTEHAVDNNEILNFRSVTHLNFIRFLLRGVACIVRVNVSRRPAPFPAWRPDKF